MSEIIDVLTLLPDDSPYFIVDTSKLAVPVLRPSQAALRMRSAGGNSWLQPGDNFTILSAGYTLPESFSMSSARANAKQTVPAFNVAVEALSSPALRYIPNFGTGGIQLPLENYEMPVGVFVNVWDLGIPQYEFRTKHFSINGTLRGLDESGLLRNNWDPTPGLPQNPLIGDFYFSTATANGWTNESMYTWDGSIWNDGIIHFVYPFVSMVGCPAALNGQKVRVNVFTKILHTKPMLFTNPDPIPE